MPIRIHRSVDARHRSAYPENHPRVAAIEPRGRFGDRRSAAILDP
jgi:hypothetical protein